MWFVKGVYVVILWLKICNDCMVMIFVLGCNCCVMIMCWGNVLYFGMIDEDYDGDFDDVYCMW